MQKELLEITSSLEFDELENVLKEQAYTSEAIRLFLQEEAKRRCQVAVDEVQRQLDYLISKCVV